MCQALPVCENTPQYAQTPTVSLAVPSSHLPVYACSLILQTRHPSHMDGLRLWYYPLDHSCVCGLTPLRQGWRGVSLKKHLPYLLGLWHHTPGHSLWCMDILSTILTFYFFCSLFWVSSHTHVLSSLLGLEHPVPAQPHWGDFLTLLSFWPPTQAIPKWECRSHPYLAHTLKPHADQPPRTTPSLSSQDSAAVIRHTLHFAWAQIPLCVTVSISSLPSMFTLPSGFPSHSYRSELFRKGRKGQEEKRRKWKQPQPFRWLWSGSLMDEIEWEA